MKTMKQLCMVKGCKKEVVGQNLCRTHYQRMYRFGTIKLKRKPVKFPHNADGTLKLNSKR